MSDLRLCDSYHHGPLAVYTKYYNVQKYIFNNLKEVSYVHQGYIYFDQTYYKFIITILYFEYV